MEMVHLLVTFSTVNLGLLLNQLEGVEFGMGTLFYSGSLPWEPIQLGLGKVAP